MQDDHYNFNTIEVKHDGNITIIPPELIHEEEFSVMAYDIYRFLAWLFPRQYGVKQLE